MVEAEKRDERLKSQKDILWGVYQEHRAHARHNETLRSTVNNMLVVASVAIISFATYDKELNQNDLAAASLLIGIGFLGLLFSASYTERALKHRSRAKECHKELNNIVFKEPVGRTLDEVIREADGRHAGSYVGKIGKVTNSHLFWLILPLVIMLAGTALLIYCNRVVNKTAPNHSQTSFNQIPSTLPSGFRVPDTV